MSTAACEHRWVYRDERAQAQAQSGHPRAASTRRGNSRAPRLRTCRRKTDQLCVALLPGDQTILTGDTLVKITDINALSLSRMHSLDEQWKCADFNCVKADSSIVQVVTDEGIVGIAEPSPYGMPSVIADNVARIKPELIGRDPFEALGIGLHPNGHSLSYDCAIAGIEAALWDIRGKIEGKRVADLLRPQGALESVRLYASGGCNYDWHSHPETLVAEVADYEKQGFTASKIRVGTKWSWDGVTPKRLLELLAEVRHAVGDNFELMLDGNCRLSEDEALEVGRGLDELHFTWFEEPIDRENRQGYVRLNQALDLPVTGGESFTTLSSFTPTSCPGPMPSHSSTLVSAA